MLDVVLFTGAQDRVERAGYTRLDSHSFDPRPGRAFALFDKFADLLAR